MMIMIIIIINFIMVTDQYNIPQIASCTTTILGVSTQVFQKGHFFKEKPMPGYPLPYGTWKTEQVTNKSIAL